ncbi:hypothetical protein BN59_03279 [Legionella massiliensis]|uniref:Uncharacterized protein n=1 Tax=Legionella massiliensis TaxID=1034943 RepID=A0A078L4G0_9GAMM|nr:hypothetical protein BN59_03279 [Legionella massiliensis]CEE14702.1 hypothetical protein BN1094_03279 [Legionella massiliensis]
MSLLVSTLRHPERSEGSPECGTVLIPEILRCALDDVARWGTGRSITGTCVETYEASRGNSQQIRGLLFFVSYKGS